MNKEEIMKDEIKEILDYLKKEVNKFEESKTYLMETYNYREQDIENIEQHKKYVYFKKILDYITNLQQENKQLKDKLARYFQAQIYKCNVFIPQKILKGSESND